MTSIRLSPKHGVNPAVTVCRLCGQSTGVALLGHLPGDKEAPRSIPDNGPCAECRELMDKGFLLVEAEDSRDGFTKLSGRKWVIRRERAQEMFDEEIVAKGAAYVTEETARRLGLYEATGGIFG